MERREGAREREGERDGAMETECKNEPDQAENVVIGS